MSLVADITLLEHRRNAALLDGDWATYDDLLGEDFFHAHVMGGVLCKEPHLDHLRNGRSRPTKIDVEDLQVWPLGEVALVTAVSHVEITHHDIDAVAELTGATRDTLLAKGARVMRHSRYLHVWASQGDQWKLVARQATYLPEGEQPLPK